MEDYESYEEFSLTSTVDDEWCDEDGEMEMFYEDERE